LFRLVKVHLKSTVPNLQPGRRYIGIVVHNQREYEFRAFGLPGQITNVGTIFDVTE
jgi:hypothetical protein